MHEICVRLSEKNCRELCSRIAEGFAPMVTCRTCGWTPKCDNCDVSLVYHKKINLLKCHYCGFTSLMPRVCPACEGIDIEDIRLWYGTDRRRGTGDIQREPDQSHGSRHHAQQGCFSGNYRELLRTQVRHPRRYADGDQRS